MSALELTVIFAEHLAEHQVAGMVSGIAAYGNVTPKGPQTYKVLVFRESKLPGLKEQLLDWERHGFLRWQDAA